MEESCAFVFEPKLLLNEKGFRTSKVKVPICDHQINDALDEEVLGVGLLERVAETEKYSYLTILECKLEAIHYYLDEITSQVENKNYENISKLQQIVEILGEKQFNA